MRDMRGWAVWIYVSLALLIGLGASALTAVSVYFAIKRVIERWESSRGQGSSSGGALLGPPRADR